MFLVLSVFLASLVLHITTGNYENGQEDKLMSSDLANVVAAIRLERAGSLTAKGALALRTLLTGTKPAFAGGSRSFQKEGDYVTALQDFFSVNPHHVKSVVGKRGESLLYGNIGDRVLLLKKDGLGGRPTLDVKDMTGLQEVTDPVFIDRIVYFEPLKSHKP